MTNNTMFYSAADVSKILGVSDSTAYKLIRQLNAELKAKGFMTIPGRISCRYFKERFYDEVSVEAAQA